MSSNASDDTAAPIWMRRHSGYWHGAAHSAARLVFFTSLTSMQPGPWVMAKGGLMLAITA
jgi:hypothetical protein